MFMDIFSIFVLFIHSYCFEEVLIRLRLLAIQLFAELIFSQKEGDMGVLER